MADERQFVLILSAHVETLRYVLRGNAHVIAVDGTAQPFYQAVSDGAVAHSQAVEADAIVEHIGGLGHIFGSARDRYVHFRLRVQAGRPC